MTDEAKKNLKSSFRKSEMVKALRQEHPVPEALVVTIVETILTATAGDRQVIEIPKVLAGVFKAFDSRLKDAGNLKLEMALELYAGEHIERMVPDLLWLHDRLVELGHHEEAQYDFGHVDRYAFFLLDQPDRKVFTLKTQSYNYFVLLQADEDVWDIHIRKYEMRHLGALQRSLFQLGSDSSCPELRYGNAGDRGYVASVKCGLESMDGPRAKGAAAYYDEIKTVLYDLKSAIDVFRHEAEQADSSTASIS